MEVDSKKLDENRIKMLNFHNLKSKTYLHEKVNSSKEIARNKDFSEEIQRLQKCN